MGCTGSTIEVVRGDSWAITGPVEDGDGNAVDLTDATITAHVREHPDSDLLVTLTGAAVGDPTEGNATLTADPADTAIDPGEYGFDVQVVSDALGTLTFAPRGTNRRRLSLTVVADYTHA